MTRDPAPGQPGDAAGSAEALDAAGARHHGAARPRPGAGPGVGPGHSGGTLIVR